jgi:flagellar hook protein FlgE
MLGSIFVGLSGLEAYSEGLKKVSNNVSNLNSTGFKTSTVTFSNLQSTRDSGGSALTNGAQSWGGGVSLSDSTINFKAGDLQTTNNDLDLAVDGTGFLVLLKGSDVRYVRTGSFTTDKSGNIVLSGTEWKLATLDSTGRAVAVSIDSSRTNAPVTTTKVVFADNLSSTGTTASVNDIAVYDASGGKHVWTATFTRAENSTNWTVTVKDSTGAAIGTSALNFENSIPSAASAKSTFTDSSTGLAVLFDFSSGVTSFSSGTVSSLRAASVDGHAVGALTTVAVNDAGELQLTYSNEQTKNLGAVAVATFRDTSALTQESAGLFQAKVGADVQLMASADDRVGLVRSKRLEGSNVDLSKEFGDLILIQRGYQASSQIISVSNDMIQQLFGIRGQG